MGADINKKSSAPKRTGNRKRGDIAKNGAGRDGANRNVGAALRSVYQETVNEDVPAEMLALLGKLG